MSIAASFRLFVGLHLVAVGFAIVFVANGESVNLPCCAVSTMVCQRRAERQVKPARRHLRFLLTHERLRCLPLLLFFNLAAFDCIASLLIAILALLFAT